MAKTLQISKSKFGLGAIATWCCNNNYELGIICTHCDECMFGMENNELHHSEELKAWLASKECTLEIVDD